MGWRGGERDAALTAIILGRIIDDNDNAQPVEGHHPPAVKNKQSKGLFRTSPHPPHQNMESQALGATQGNRPDRGNVPGSSLS